MANFIRPIIQVKNFVKPRNEVYVRKMKIMDFHLINNNNMKARQFTLSLSSLVSKILESLRDSGLFDAGAEATSPGSLSAIFVDKTTTVGQIDQIRISKVFHRKVGMVESVFTPKGIRLSLYRKFYDKTLLNQFAL